MKIFEDPYFWNRLSENAPGTSSDPRFRRLYYQCDGGECYIDIEVGSYHTSNVFRNKYLRTNRFLISDVMVADLVISYTRDVRFNYQLSNEKVEADHLWMCDPQTVEHHLMMIKLQLPDV